MDTYVTGTIIRRLREARGMTQSGLAEALGVSGKAVSNWETGRGYPDITLLEPLAAALGVSVLELLSGCSVSNRNRAFDMRRCVFHVCPVCGSIHVGTGDAVLCCCGVTLPPLEAEAPDEAHALRIEPVEDEYYVTLSHEMTRTHQIAFLAALRDQSVELVRLYPEWEAGARFKRNGVRALLAYCNRHGLFRTELPLRGAGRQPTGAP